MPVDHAFACMLTLPSKRIEVQRRKRVRHSMNRYMHNNNRAASQSGSQSANANILNSVFFIIKKNIIIVF